LLLGSALAYAISRFGTGGRNYPYTILTLRMVPPIVVAIPMLIDYTSIPEFFAWLIGRRVEFFDSYYGLTLLYIATTLPYAIWMMLAFIDEVPCELEHALDGGESPGHPAAGGLSPGGLGDVGDPALRVHPELERVPAGLDPQPAQG